MDVSGNLCVLRFLLSTFVGASALLYQATIVAAETEFLRAEKTKLVFRGNEVFLSGANQPWIQYGRDFGNNQTNGLRCELEEYIRNISDSGGNVVRMWLFVEGQSAPLFDTAGFVTGTDQTGTLVEDVRNYVRYAASRNVFVVLTLWNGALMRNENVKNIFLDDDKLQSFFDNALTPLVSALRSEPGLAAYEIINEPEGSVAIVEDAEPCFDTASVLTGSGAGWAGASIPMKRIQKFVNLHAASIKAADGKALVTVGSWSQYASTDNANLEVGRKFFNYWKNACLVKAGGEANGVLDLYQIHTYARGGEFAVSSPMVVASSRLDLDKPVIIGEFSAKGCARAGCTVESLYNHALDAKYSGCLDWSMIGGDGEDDASVAERGMSALRDQGVVNISLASEVQPPADTCSCSDMPPDVSYTCAQQASFGKCDEPWMKGFCCRSCFSCRGCV